MKRASSLRLSRPKPIGRSVSMAATSDLLAFCLRGPAGSRDDVLVARAAADGAGDRRAYLMLGGVGVLVQQRANRQHHPRRAEAALQRVQLMEALLHRVELSVARKPFDGADLRALAHHGERGAGLDRLAVLEHHAGAAVGRVAAPVGAREVERLANEV